MDENVSRRLWEERLSVRGENTNLWREMGLGKKRRSKPRRKEIDAISREGASSVNELNVVIKGRVSKRIPRRTGGDRRDEKDRRRRDVRSKGFRRTRS